jgi:hypothetical protein
MLLALAFDDPFAAAPIDPSLQSVEFIDRGLMSVFQLLMRGSRLIEHAAELRHLPFGVDNSTLVSCGFLESSQQELTALGKIVGEKVGVIHNANCFNNSCQS